MIQHLKIRLIIIFSLLTGLILSLAVFFTLKLNIRDYQNEYLSRFQSALDSLESYFRSVTVIKDSYLREQEMNNNCIIYVTDNGSPFYFQGSDILSDEREELISCVLMRLENNDDVPKSLLSVAEEKDSSVFYFTGSNDKKNVYLGGYTHFMIDNEQDITIYMIKDKEDYNARIRSMYLNYGLLTLGGVLLLTIVIYIMVSLALRPAKETLKQQQEFIAAASHELRSPLTVIRTNLELLKDEMSENVSAQSDKRINTNNIKSKNKTDSKNLTELSSCEESDSENKTDSNPSVSALSDHNPTQSENSTIQPEHDFVQSDHLLDISLKETERMKHLTDDLLTLTNLDAKEKKVPLSDVSADSILMETYDAFYGICKKNNHPLTISLPNEELPHIESNEEALKQLLGIFIQNAISHTPENTGIEIKGKEENGTLLLSVIDHGEGIPDAIKNKVFLRFYQKDQSRTDKSHYGLGLSIAKELSEALHCKLKLSDTAGGGATFTLRFGSELIHSDQRKNHN